MNYITTQEGLQEVLDWLDGRRYFVFDTETGPAEKYVEDWYKNNKIGLDPYRSEIVTAQIGDRHNQFIIDCRVGLNLDPIKEFLHSDDVGVLGVNLRYDAKMVQHHWGVRLRRAIDCMIIEQVARAGIFPGSYSDNHGTAAGIVRRHTGMKALAERYLNIEIDKDKDLRIQLWKTPPGEFNDRQLDYMANDLVFPDLIVEKQKKLIKERNLEGVIQLEHRLIPVVADMELTGIPFDKGYWVSLLQDSIQEKHKAEVILDRHFNNSSTAQEDLFGNASVQKKYDYGSWQQLAKALHNAGYSGFVSESGKPLSTNKDKITLKKISGEIPEELADAIVKFKKANKKESSYGTNFVNAVNPVTNRIHPSFTQCCLVTGRMSCSPGMQTIPRDSIYRHAFIAPKGYRLIILDASQIEARISADKTGDVPAIKVFQEGGDIYSVDGGLLYNTTIDRSTKEGEELRSRAKVSWLGLSYGQGKRKFHRFCKVFLGKDIKKSETDYLYDKFFEIHWRMKEVMDQWSDEVSPFSGRYVYDDLADELIDHDVAYERLYKIFLDRFDGRDEDAEHMAQRLLNQKDRVTYAETALGRKRFFRADYTGWWTAGRNYIIQAEAADIQKSIMLAYQELHWDEGYDAHIINVIHDEIVTLVKEEQSEELFNKQKELGEAVGQRFLKDVPMKLEGGVEDKWMKL